MVNKKGDITQQVIIQIILIAIVLAMFVFTTADKVNGRGTRQEILESQTAMLLNAAVPGMSFGIFKLNPNGIINDVKIEKGHVFIAIDGLASLSGKSYFSRYNIEVVEEQNKFILKVS